MAGGPHVSISAETLFHFGPLAFTNSMLTSVIVSGLLILFAFLVSRSYKDTDKPSGLQNFAEFLIEIFYNMIQGITNSAEKTIKFFPFITSFFLFIALNNWLGLLPGVGTIYLVPNEVEEVHADRSIQLVPQANAVTAENPQAQLQEQPLDETILLETSETGAEVHEEVEEHIERIPLFRAGTADLNTTLALAIFSQVVAQLFGLRYVGWDYLKKFFNFSNPILMFVGILEFMGEFTRAISFAFRLFGNIFAGEVLLTVIAFLVPIVVPMPFYGLELFVGFMQALVFTMLSLVFFNMATMSHEEH